VQKNAQQLQPLSIQSQATHTHVEVIMAEMARFDTVLARISKQRALVLEPAARQADTRKQQHVPNNASVKRTKVLKVASDQS